MAGEEVTSEAGRDERSTVTRLLQAAAAGDSRAPGQLLEIVYGHLRMIAEQRMKGERRGHTLQATALVHEAYLRLLGNEKKEWEGRGHFYRAAAEAMRKVLIDHARGKNAVKRGGGRVALSITGVAELAESEDCSGILAMDEAIVRLGGVDAQAGDVVRLRFYAGLSVEETAEALGLSAKTVQRSWAFARGWLRDALEREGE